MSRIGKKPINLPKNVELKTEAGLILVKGPKGELKKSLDPHLEVEVGEGLIFVRFKEKKGELSRLQGLYRSLISNMIRGVESGFERVLIFQGVGFKAAVAGNGLELSLGFSHPLRLEAPANINFKVEKNKIIVGGIDKELVGQIASQIRSLKKPEPYKGSGIRYEGEIIIKKAGKKAVTTAG